MQLGLQNPDLGAFRNTQVSEKVSCFQNPSKNFMVGYSQERRVQVMESQGGKTNTFSSISASAWRYAEVIKIPV